MKKTIVIRWEFDFDPEWNDPESPDRFDNGYLACLCDIIEEYGTSLFRKFHCKFDPKGLDYGEIEEHG